MGNKRPSFSDSFKAKVTVVAAIELMIFSELVNIYQ
jgi:hypothetical protein